MPYPINQRAHQFNSIQSVPVSFGLWDTALKFLSPGPRSDVTDHLGEIIWSGELPHPSGLPHLPGVPYLHVNRPSKSLMVKNRHIRWTSLCTKGIFRASSHLCLPLMRFLELSFRRSFVELSYCLFYFVF